LAKFQKYIDRVMPEATDVSGYRSTRLPMADQVLQIPERLWRYGAAMRPEMIFDIGG